MTYPGITPFNYYGNKRAMLPHILPLLNTDHMHYIEAFAGSAAVLLNKPTSSVETLNDLNDEVMNFYRVLRNQKNTLLNSLRMTPYSRTEYVRCLSKGNGRRLTPIERARRFYVRTMMTVNGGPENASSGRWRHNITSNGNVAKQFSDRIEKLPVIEERLNRVVFENLDALFLLEKYGTKRTLFYFDPPLSSEYQKKGHRSELPGLWRF